MYLYLSDLLLPKFIPHFVKYMYVKSLKETLRLKTMERLFVSINSDKRNVISNNM